MTPWTVFSKLLHENCMNSEPTFLRGTSRGCGLHVGSGCLVFVAPRRLPSTCVSTVRLWLYKNGGELNETYPLGSSHHVCGGCSRSRLIQTRFIRTRLIRDFGQFELAPRELNTAKQATHAPRSFCMKETAYGNSRFENHSFGRNWIGENQRGWLLCTMTSETRGKKKTRKKGNYTSYTWTIIMQTNALRMQ